MYIESSAHEKWGQNEKCCVYIFVQCIYIYVPAFLCIITIPKPVRVEKITVNNVIFYLSLPIDGFIVRTRLDRS